MDPKPTDPLQTPNAPFVTSAHTAGNRTHTDRDRRHEHQRVTKDWRDLAELLQQSSN
jgi:hypothetical protein